MKIFKYPIPIRDTFSINIPEGGEILSFQVQTGTPCIWVAIPNENAQYEYRRFMVVGTGHAFDARGTKYIGTIQMNEGTLVWHLFEDLQY